MLSLRWKISGALLLVVLVSVGLMAFLTNLNTSSQFRQYVTGSSQMYYRNVASNLEEYYTLHRDWTGIQETLNVSLRTNTDRLVLADINGNIVADTSNALLGKTDSSLKSTTNIDLKTGNLKMGTLYIILSSSGSGRGKGWGSGNSQNGGTDNSNLTQMTQTIDREFIDRINNYLWIAAAIAILAALIIGILIARQITRPVKALTTGARKISDGDLYYRVKVHSRDELGRLAESFNIMASNLEKSELARKRLVSDVSHELRTPLTIIEGTVDGIMDGVFPADQEHLNSIKEQTASLSHLVSDLRDLSQAESGQLKLQKQPTNIADLLNRKLTQFEVSARTKNIQLKLEAQNNLPEIAVDSRRIEQVISNLLSNAIRHTPEKGTIIVGLKSVDSNTNTLKRSLIISVSDNGEGIPPEHLPHIFERFYRVETSRSRIEGERGAGLGLAIVKHMIEAHGGQVSVESQPGKGSTFYITLPL